VRLKAALQRKTEQTPDQLATGAPHGCEHRPRNGWTQARAKRSAPSVPAAPFLATSSARGRIASLWGRLYPRGAGARL